MIKIWSIFCLSEMSTGSLVAHSEENVRVDEETGERQTPRMWLRYRWFATNTNTVSRTEDALRKLVAMRATRIALFGPHMPLRDRTLLVRAFSCVRCVSIRNTSDENVFRALCAAIRHPDSRIEELWIHDCDRVDDQRFLEFWDAAKKSKRLRMIATDNPTFVVGIRYSDTLEAMCFSSGCCIEFGLVDGMLRKFPSLKRVAGLSNEMWEFRAAWPKCYAAKDDCGRRVVVRAPEV